MNQLLNVLQQKQHILLLPHIHADGDALGSCFALAALLQDMEKQATVVLEEEPLPVYDKIVGEYTLQSVSTPYDFVILVDCNDVSRLGKRADLVVGDMACIDHHRTTDSLPPLYYVDDTAAATGELVYSFASLLGQIDTQTALCLYFALVSDTGCFRYSNTTPRTLRIAAELMEKGIDTVSVSRDLFETFSLKKMQYRSSCISSMQLLENNRIGICTLPYETMQKQELTMDDTEGIANLILTIDSVVMGVYFHEREPGKWKVSLRSDESTDVARIAATFGGGGHLRAAGYSFEGTEETAIKQLLAETKQQWLERKQ